MSNNTQPSAEERAAQRRADVISGLRALADFLEANPEVPARESVTFQYSAAAFTSTYEEACAEVDRVAELLGVVAGKPWEDAHYQANWDFGPVQYHAVAVLRADPDAAVAAEQMAEV